MADLSAIFKVLGRGLARVTEPCRIPGCRAHSMGFICGECSRFVCNFHGYATMPGLKKPTIICASCIIDRHQELLEDVPEEREPRARQENNGQRERDPSVVDAEWERVG